MLRFRPLRHPKKRMQRKTEKDMDRLFLLSLTLIILVLAAAACGTNASPSPEAEPVPEKEYKIVTVLGFDAIPAILDPQFLSAAEAQEQYRDVEQVLGVSVAGDNRAYPVPFLSSHEIVNDVVGGVPLAVTW